LSTAERLQALGHGLTSLRNQRDNAARNGTRSSVAGSIPGICRAVTRTIQAASMQKERLCIVVQPGYVGCVDVSVVGDLQATLAALLPLFERKTDA
jgi:hypothetical protein